MYYCANDGSYEALKANQWDLFKATRSSDQENFIYHNEKLIPKCFEGETFNVSRVLSADNEYILLCTHPNTNPPNKGIWNTNGWLIMTHNSSDPKDWDEKIDLSFMGFTNSFSGVRETTPLIRYIKSKNKLIVVRTSSSLDDKVGYFEVWDMNTKTKKFSTTIPGFNKLIKVPSPYSFHDNKTVRVWYDISKIFNSEGWRRNGYIYIYEADLLRIHWMPTITLYNQNNDNSSSSWYMVGNFVYKVPKSIVDNYSGTITLLNSTTDTGDGVIQYNQPIVWSNTSIRPEACNTISYDTQNSRYYVYGAYDRDSILAVCYRFTNADQVAGVSPKTLYRGMYKTGGGSVTVGGNITPIDSSLWGKGWRINYMAENIFFLLGQSKTVAEGAINMSYLITNQFQKYKTTPNDRLVIEPTPGHYRVGNTFTDLYKASYNVTSDTSARLFKISSEENYTKVNEYTVIPYNQGSKDQFNITRYKNYTNIKWNDLIAYSGYDFRNGNCISYNYFEELAVVLFQYPNTPGSAYRLCFGLKVYSLKSNKLLHFFTPEELNRLIPAYNYFVNYNTSTRPHDIVIYFFSASIWLNSTKLLLYIFCSNNSTTNNNFNRPLMIEFNSTFTSIVNSHTIAVGGQQLWLPCLNYNCGQWGKYGLVHQDLSGYTPILMIYTQKPLISGYGNKNNPTDQVISNLENMNCYYIYIQSAQGLICYIPSTNIFLGGYYTVIDQPISVNLTANADNYIYLERGDDRDTINAYATTEQLYYEGQRLFSKICVAKITTDEANITAVEYYRINIGYNDYIWNGGG